MSTTSSRVPDDFGTHLPALPKCGPRALTDADLKGFTETQWAEIIAKETDSNAAYMRGIRRKGYLAHRKGKPCKSPYFISKYSRAWISGYRDFK